MIMLNNRLSLPLLFRLVTGCYLGNLLIEVRGVRGVTVYLFMILCYWYQKQEMTVRWGACISDSFKVTNCARESGILSPNFLI